MIRVLVVDDHAVVRAGVCNLLGVEEDIAPLPPVSGVAEAMAAFERHEPDVVVADYRLGDGDGLTLCRRLEEQSWPAPVLIFSGYANEELAVVAAVAGATGLVSKGAAGDALFAAVRRVAAGGSHGLEVSHLLVTRAAERIAPDDFPVLGMRLQCCSPAEIAEVLRIRLSETNRRIDRIIEILRPHIESLGFGPGEQARGTHL